MKNKKEEIEEENSNESKKKISRAKGKNKEKKTKHDINNKKVEEKCIDYILKYCLPYTEYIEKEITGDGNCFFRSLAYYYRNKEDDYNEFRILLYEWIKINKDLFIDMIPEIDSLNNVLSLDERRNKLNEKIEKIKIEGEWAGDLEISATCVMLNINIYLYIKDNFYYSPYFKFEVVQNPTDIIDLLFVDLNH